MIEKRKLWRVIKSGGEVDLNKLDEVLKRNGYASIVGLQIGSVEVVLLATDEQVKHLKQSGEIEIYSEYVPDGQVDGYLLRLVACLLLEILEKLKTAG